MPKDTQAPSLSSLIDRVLRDEAMAILTYADRKDTALVDAARMIHGAAGPLVVAGIGKSAHIARKIASTFRSLGHRAVFLHAGEASHGDLGLLSNDAIVLVLSNSGETSELSDLLHYCRTHRIKMIALTGNASSTLARFSDLVIAYGPCREACINGLAPTTSTTMSLAIGDALAVAVSQLSNIQPEDFRRYHPGGQLGALLLSVRDVMRSGDEMPAVSAETSMTETVVVMSGKGVGVAVVMKGGRAQGIITDGDLRRNMDRLWSSTAGDIATPNPVRVSSFLRIDEALRLMKEKAITVCVVDEDGKDAGIVHIHDCLGGARA